MTMGYLYFSLVLFALLKSAYSFSDVGKWDLPMTGDNCAFTLAKSLFKGSKLKITLHCDVSVPTNLTVTYKWYPTICSPDYFHYFEKNLVECKYFDMRQTRSVRAAIAQNYTDPLETTVEKTYTCDGKETIFIVDDSKSVASDIKMTDDSVAQSKAPALLTVQQEGVYALHVSVTSYRGAFNASFRVEMIAPSGYMSAAIWPLLPFFGILCGVYTVLCSAWLIVCGLQWKDLLRIQYWIGGVALLGMVESATYYGVYAAINRTGYFNSEAYMFAEWVSVAKRALARMLVIIVSLGFGIVKPRLGPALQRVVGAGALWALLAGAEAWLRLHHKADGSNRDLLLAEAPLSLLDSAICWWVFVSLASTMRTLQLRRNAIKLSLYRHFMNTLVFAVVSSVVFMLYSIKSYRVQICITEWKGVWMDEAYWHMLFASVMTVIMVLWRPTNNNQRYAFTPLLDNAEDDEDEEDQFVNDAYGVKMRGTSISGGGDMDSAKDQDPRESSKSLESDLRWVEENIPSSTMPLLDSDEEIINTKFEVSKMQ